MEKKSSQKKWYYLLFLIALFYYYATGQTYYEERISDVLGRYLGNGKYIIMFVLVLNFFTMNIEDKKKRDIATWLSYSIYPTYLAIVFLIVSMRIGALSENHVENVQLYFINLTVFEIKIGLIGTYLLSLVVFSKNIYIYWGVFVFSIVLILLMMIALFNHLVLKNFKKIIKEYSKKRELEKDEEIILEKIALKESLEKKELEQIEKFKENQKNKKEQEKEEKQRNKESEIQDTEYTWDEEEYKEQYKEQEYLEDQECQKVYKNNEEQEYLEELENNKEHQEEQEQKKKDQKMGETVDKFTPVLRIYEVKGEKKIISLKKNIIEEKTDLKRFFDDDFLLFDEKLPPSEQDFTNSVEEFSFSEEDNRKKNNEEVEF